ncbi:MAG: zinc-ribbon domain-containing protein [Clostridium sp.]|nr:zinc-ribbon domain-containing protein [Clostridium sp.]
MKCKKCGASLADTDRFCDQCGWKVVRQRRCPECGASLREGTKFCPKCGRLIGGENDSDGEKVFVKDAETLDIPIADIEQNILVETKKEIGGSEKPKKPAVKKKAPAPEPKKREKPAPVKKRVYDEWDEDDEDDDDEEDDGPDIITIITVVMGILILVVAAALVFLHFINIPIADYGKSLEQDIEENGDDGNNGEMPPEEGNEENPGDVDDEPFIGTLSIIDNVNVRDNPSKEGTNIIKVAKAGETYQYTGTVDDGSWYAIILEDGSTGYVFAEYVSVE